MIPYMPLYDIASDLSSLVVSSFKQGNCSPFRFDKKSLPKKLD
jgi:hypothetical protein